MMMEKMENIGEIREKLEKKMLMIYKDNSKIMKKIKISMNSQRNG
jgi:hypothetical protein